MQITGQIKGYFDKEATLYLYHIKFDIRGENVIQVLIRNTEKSFNSACNETML